MYQRRFSRPPDTHQQFEQLRI
jgi:hypothetical protein